MSRYVLVITLILLTCFSYGQKLPKLLSVNDFSIGKSIVINSTELSENRQINIYLPDSYFIDSLKSFPVIYLLDGSRDEDFIHISGIVQFGSFSWINMIPESIVVGIANVDRRRDFTYPSENELDRKNLPTSGKSEKFIQFIDRELQPFIEVNYRTTTKKTLIGQSLGGLLATEILFKHPDLFNNYIIVSPSLWWDNENLLDYNLKALGKQKSIYIGVGKEGEVMERTAKELFVKLNNLQSDGTNIYFDFLENKTHGDALHLAVYNAFEKMFKEVTK